MRKGIAGLAAGIVGVLWLAALAPTAQAHPCAVAWTLENASFLSANNAAWAAKLPTVEEFSEAECAGAEEVPAGHGEGEVVERIHRFPALLVEDFVQVEDQVAGHGVRDGRGGRRRLQLSRCPAPLATLRRRRGPPPPPRYVWTTLA